MAGITCQSISHDASRVTPPKCTSHLPRRVCAFISIVRLLIEETARCIPGWLRQQSVA